MSRANNVEQAEKNAAKSDSDTAVLSAQISTRFAKAIGIYTEQHKGEALPFRVSEPLSDDQQKATLLTVKADLYRASVADVIEYTFLPSELIRKDSGDARKATFAHLKSQASLAEKLMAMMEAHGMGDELRAMLAEGK